MKHRLLGILAALVLLLSITGYALAKNNADVKLWKETVNLYWNEDGALTLDYFYVMSVDSSGLPWLDSVRINLPGKDYSLADVKADLDGVNIQNITKDNGSLILKLPSIAPQTKNTYGAVQVDKQFSLHVSASGLDQLLLTDDPDANYYTTGWFVPESFRNVSSAVKTENTVIFHLPPGMPASEARASADDASDPVIGQDSDGRVTFTWTRQLTNDGRSYAYRASFPKKYVVVPTISDSPANPSKPMDAARGQLELILLAIGALALMAAPLAVLLPKQKCVKCAAKYPRIYDQCPKCKTFSASFPASGSSRAALAASGERSLFTLRGLIMAGLVAVLIAMVMLCVYAFTDYFPAGKEFTETSNITGMAGLLLLPFIFLVEMTTLGVKSGRRVMAALGGLAIILWWDITALVLHSQTFFWLAIALTGLILFVFAVIYLAGKIDLYNKRCTGCGKRVSDHSYSGGICPHCGARWDFEEKRNF